jgi:hypothetical protein
MAFDFDSLPDPLAPAPIFRGTTNPREIQAIGEAGGYRVDPSVQRDRDEIRLSMLKDELDNETDPTVIAARKKEIAVQEKKLGTKASDKPFSFDDLPDPLVGTKDSKPFSFDDLPDPLAGSPTPKTPTKEYGSIDPGWGSVIAQGGATAVGDIGKAIGTGVGALINKGSELVGGPADVADPMIQNSQQFGKDLGTKFLTSQEQQNESIPQAVVSGITGVLPYVALGPAGAAAAAGVGAMNTGTSLLDQGASLGQAQAGAVATGATTYGGMKIPMTSPTMAGGAVRGAGGMVAAGIANDLIIQKVMSDKPDIAAQYDPWDAKKIIVSAATGGVFGAFQHGQENVALAREIKKNTEATDLIQKQADAKIAQAGIEAKATADVEGMVQDLASPRVKSGVALEDLHTMQGANLFDAYDAIIAHPDARPDQVELAKALIRLHDVNGTGETPLDFTNQGTARTAEYWRGRTKYGNFETGDAPYKIETLLHEGLHAASSGSVQFYLSSKRDSLQDPAKRDLWDRVDSLNSLFKSLKEKYKTKTGDNPDEINARYEAILKDIKDNQDNGTPRKYSNAEWDDIRQRITPVYGFKDLHEFISETLSTGSEFRDFLRGEKLTAQEVAERKINNRGVVSNAWEAVKNAIKRIISPNSHPNSQLDVAMDHIFNVVENTQASHPHDAIIYEKHTEARQKILDAALAKRDETPAGSLAKAKMKMITDLLDVVGTDKDMFNTRVRAIDSSPEWQRMIDRQLDTIWDNARRLREAHGLEEDYQSHGEVDRQLTHNPMNVDEMIELAVGDRPLTQKDDLNTLGTQTMSGSILAMMKSNTVAGKILKFVVDKAQEYRALQAIVFHKSMESFAEFNALPYKEKKQMMQAAIDVNTIEYRERLKSQNLQWPTEQMLRESHPNLSDKQVSAYLKVTEGLDFLHNLLNQTRTALGKDPLQQIPGYMPHVFDGAYKVFVYQHPTTDPDKKFTVLVKGFDTKYGALGYVNEVRSGKFDTPDFKHGVDTDGQTGLDYKIRKSGDMTSGVMTAMQEHLHAYQRQLVLAPEALKVLEAMEKQSMQGFTKHELERSDISGYVGEFGFKDKAWRKNAEGKYEFDYEGLKEQLGIGSNYNKKILSLYENYARSVTDYYKNVLWTKEVAARLSTMSPDGETPNFGMLFSETPKLQKYLSEFGHNFTGENINKLAWVDISKKVGIDPHLYRSFGRDARNLLSMIKLRANPGNYLANIVQPGMMLSLLQFANASRATTGQKSPNVLATLTKVLGKKIGKLDPDMQAAVDWAREQHILEATLEPEMRGADPSRLQKFMHTVTGGGINPAIESIGRKTSFELAYEHFRGIYPDNPMAARRAAANLMEMGMVNYDRSARPLMYQTLGFVGEQISPFAVFRNAYVGNTILMLKMAKQNPTTLSSYMPMMAMQATYLVTAGALGMIGAAEYDMVVNFLNSQFPEWSLPNFHEVLLKNHVPDFITYGALSNATKAIPGLEDGVNFSGSMAAVGVPDLFNMAMIPFVEAMAAAVGYPAHMLLSKLTDKVNPPNSAEAFKAGSQVIPGIFKPYWENQFKDNPGVAIDQHLQGYVPRSESSLNAMKFVGRQSMTEATDRAAEWTRKNTDMMIQASLKTLTGLAADRATAPGYQGPPLSVLQQRAGELGVSSDDFLKGVVEVINNRRTTVRSREAQQSTINAVRGQKERYEMGY